MCVWMDGRTEQLPRWFHALRALRRLRRQVGLKGFILFVISHGSLQVGVLLAGENLCPEVSPDANEDDVSKVQGPKARADNTCK